MSDVASLAVKLISSLPTVLPPQLSICSFVSSEPLAQSLKEFLSEDRYSLTQVTTKPEFFDFLEQYKQQLDCLILQEDRSLLPVVNRLHERGTLLPVVILASSTLASEPTQTQPTHIYHAAEVYASAEQINQIEHLIEVAIAQFLDLAPNYHRPSQYATVEPTIKLTAQNFLMQQQRRLAEKLKERLGYLGVYYKRNPKSFFRHLSATEKQEFLDNFSLMYRQIVLNYFSNDETLNQKIDNFVNMAFLADISVSQIVEIHMELMDKFAKHLKLEGRSEEVLLDYRLTLIDIIAHLCEMYRRSIPREL